MTSTEAPAVWHHPNFVACRQDRHQQVYSFRPFTGNEPEPDLPDGAWDIAQAHGANADAVHRAIRDEVRAARTMWYVAKFRRTMEPLLREASPAAQEYQRTRKTAEDAYTALDDTEDNKWRSALLRLTVARQDALDAAAAWDTAAYPICEAREQMPERLEDRLPSLQEIGTEIGVETSGWELHYTGDYTNYGGWEMKSPSADALRKLFNEQDERIKQVADLVGTDS